MKYSLVAFVLAFVGMSYEFLISQSIASLFGGTFFHTILTFSVFTFSLGLGALAFQKIPAYWVGSRVLGFLQLGLSFFVVILPYFYRWIDGASVGVGGGGFFIVLAYFPALIVGFVTGFEIPFLMRLDHLRPVRVLAFDFLGMFLGTLLFPTWMLYRLGLFEGLTFCAALNCMMGLFLLRGASSQPPVQAVVSRQTAVSGQTPRSDDTPGSAGDRHGDHRKTLLLAFVLSFCSFSYETVLTKFVLSIVGDGLINQVFHLGTFILGLGLGGLWSERRGLAQARERLIRVEMGLSALVMLTPALVLGAASYFDLFHRPIIQYGTELLGTSPLSFLFLIFPLSIGFLTGTELPLLFYSEGLKGDEPRAVQLLSLNYFGALMGGVLSVVTLLPLMGSGLLLMTMGLVNILILLVLVLEQTRKWNHKKLLGPAFALLLALFGVMSFRPIQEAHLKIHYLRFSLSDFSIESLHSLKSVLSFSSEVLRFESRYQVMDLVFGDTNQLPLQEETGFSLYLNLHPQFHSDSWKTYHESFVWGSLNLNRRKPKTVLVLGGGDGLLVRELLRIPEIEKITVVEIDPLMVRFANEMSSFTQLNQYSLMDPRVEVVIGDAYHFAKVQARMKADRFDGIYIDFPYPNSYDLARLYSLEFYRNVVQLLEPHGFVILDAPLSRNLEKEDSADTFRHSVMISTLKAAGLQRLLPFGPFDPLIFATPNPGPPLEFDYEQVPELIQPKSFFNLKDILHVVDMEKVGPQWVNSIFSPKWLQ